MTPFFDRTTCNPFKYQLGYIDVVVMPLMLTWCEFKPAFTEDCMTKGLQENKKLLEQKVEETKAIMQMRDLPAQRGDSGFSQPQSPSQAQAALGQSQSV